MKDHFFIKESIYGLLLQCKRRPHPVRMSRAHEAKSHDVLDSPVLLLLRLKQAASRSWYSGGVEGYDLINTVMRQIIVQSSVTAPDLAWTKHSLCGLATLLLRTRLNECVRLMRVLTGLSLRVHVLIDPQSQRDTYGTQKRMISTASSWWWMTQSQASDEWCRVKLVMNDAEPSFRRGCASVRVTNLTSWLRLCD